MQWEKNLCSQYVRIIPFDTVYEIENTYHLSIELWKHEWKFGGKRNAVGTQAEGECFHSFLFLLSCFVFEVNTSSVLKRNYCFKFF